MNCSAPYLVHWHLRKMAGTVVRDALRPGLSERYVEAHCNFACLQRWERRLPPSACWQRLVILREPYSHLLSELDHFPFTFMPPPHEQQPSPHIHDNHMLCGRDAMMGLCTGGTGECDADAVLRVLESFHFVGFFEFLDRTFDALKQWVACDTSGSLSPATQAQMHARLARQSDSFRRGCWAGGCSGISEAREAARRDLVHGTDAHTHNASARLHSRHQNLRDNRTRDAAAWVLARAPNRSTFEAHHACAIRVYSEALRRWGPEGTGGPTGRPSSCKAGEGQWHA